MNKDKNNKAITTSKEKNFKFYGYLRIKNNTSFEENMRYLKSLN